MYHIVLRVRLQILLPKMFQDSYFDESLMMEPLFVPARTVKVAPLFNKETTRHRKQTENAGCIDARSLRGIVLES